MYQIERYGPNHFVVGCGVILANNCAVFLHDHQTTDYRQMIVVNPLCRYWSLTLCHPPAVVIGWY